MTDVDGRKIGDLAAADVRVIRIELSEAERHFYNALYSRSKQRFQSLIASKQNAAQNYTLILTLLTRLRQACDHPFLLVGGRGGGQQRRRRRRPQQHPLSLPMVVTAPFLRL